MTRRTLFLLTCLLALVLALAACGGRGAAETPVAEGDATAAVVAEEAAETEATEAPQPTDTPESAEAPEPTDTPEPTAATEAEQTETDLNLEDREAGLETLESYRLTWRTEFTPNDTTQTPFVWEWSQEVIKEPPAMHFMWRAEGADTGSGTAPFSEIWSVGDMTYMRSGEDPDNTQCVAFNRDDPTDTTPMFNPSMLGGVSGAKYAGRETVNGIPTRKYTYDTGAFTLLGADKVEGTMWVAEDGGYAVKDEVRWSGKSGLFVGEERGEGEGKWVWEVSDANQVSEIALPEECAAGVEDLGVPVLPDAKIMMKTAEMVQYTSQTPLADAVEFYEQEMPAAGWSVEGEPTNMGQMASLQYSKDGKNATIMIIAGDESETTVMITLG
jgi:predicted small lipoprotein YifL